MPRMKSQFVIIWQKSDGAIDAQQCTDKDHATELLSSDMGGIAPVFVIRGELVSFATRTVIEDAPKQKRAPRAKQSHKPSVSTLPPDGVKKRRTTKKEKAALALALDEKNGEGDGMATHETSAD